MFHHSKNCLNRCVLSIDLKDKTVFAFRISVGSLFHNCGATTEKALPPCFNLLNLCSTSVPVRTVLDLKFRGGL